MGESSSCGLAVEQLQTLGLLLFDCHIFPEFIHAFVIVYRSDLLVKRSPVDLFDVSDCRLKYSVVLPDEMPELGFDRKLWRCYDSLV